MNPVILFSFYLVCFHWQDADANIENNSAGGGECEFVGHVGKWTSFFRCPTAEQYVKISSDLWANVDDAEIMVCCLDTKCDLSDVRFEVTRVNFDAINVDPYVLLEDKSNCEILKDERDYVTPQIKVDDELQRELSTLSAEESVLLSEHIPPQLPVLVNAPAEVTEATSDVVPQIITATTQNIVDLTPTANVNGVDTTDEVGAPCLFNEEPGVWTYSSYCPKLAVPTNHNSKNIGCCKPITISGQKCQEYGRLRAGACEQYSDWPFMVDLYTSNVFRLHFHCSGFLVSEKFVITTAYCLDESLSEASSYVRIGTKNQSPFIKVAEKIIHPDYDGHSIHLNNIGLLRLATAVIFTADVYPACLSQRHVNVAKNYTMVGTRHRRDRFLKLDVPVMEATECNVHFPGYNLEDENFCIDILNSMQVCKMKMGSPIICRNMKPLCGTTVIGFKVNYSTGCGVQNFIYVAAHLAWIEANVWG